MLDDSKRLSSCFSSDFRMGPNGNQGAWAVNGRDRMKPVIRSGSSETARRWLAWILAGVASTLLLFSGLKKVRSAAPDAAAVIPPGTALTIRLRHPLTSRTARLGDVFEAWVVSTKTPKGTPSIPLGARVEGRCVAAREGEADGRPGYLRLALSGLRDSRGHLTPLETMTFSVWGSRALEAQSESAELAKPAPQMAREHSSASAGESHQAVVTPEASLTFVLLRPVAVAGQQGEP